MAGYYGHTLRLGYILATMGLIEAYRMASQAFSENPHFYENIEIPVIGISLVGAVCALATARRMRI